MEYFALDLFHPETIIKYGGIALLLIVIFIETGLFFGFFLPGDSLLFVAGIFCDSEYISTPVWLLLILITVAAVSGTTVGYGFGYWIKDYFAKRKENFFYRRKYIEITEEFYRRHGMSAFILGRFLPVIRTFVPILAGIVKVDFKLFLLYNIIGAVAWSAPLVLSGYWLGNSFPAITEYLEFIIVGMIVLTALPIMYSWIRHKRYPLKEKV